MFMATFSVVIRRLLNTLLSWLFWFLYLLYSIAYKAFSQAIERRRERLGTEEIEQTGTPVHANQLTIFSDPSSFSAAFGSSSRVHKKSPKSCIKLSTPYGSKVPKIIIDIAKLPAAEDGESELLTPQKKQLLHSIDIIEREVKQ
ncbi:uncharacterized protein [Medicago truncatula]|uniref:uncharacterized protein n=1 Tax=Medicago truncatula TaxID=3880 RepID=UPI00196814C8|nr:uncharacterized protein LOC120580934 [Medicago truncatula]